MSPSSTVRRRRSPPRDSRADVFAAAAELFSARGFDGVGIDDIAHAARLNKAMIYYHFDSKRALYREVVQDMLRAVGTLATEAASSHDTADRRLAAFIAALIHMADERPWFPPLMLREIAEGAPRLEPDTLALMKTVFLAFSHILADGQASGRFRPINPVLAYMSIIAPILLNAARERAAARPGRLALPMFAEVSHADLTAHMQQAALRLLSVQEPRP